MAERTTLWSRLLSALRTDKQSVVPAPLTIQRFFASGLSLTIVFFIVQCISGVLLSLNYIPSTAPATNNEGQALVQARAVRVVVDADGDTLFLKDQFCMLARSARTGGIDYPTADSTAFALLTSADAQASQSWMSVEHSMTHVLPYGVALRGIHIWSSHLLILCVIALLLGGLVLRVYRFSSEMRWMRLVAITLLCIFTAWLGSILPWNIRSAMSLPIVSSFIEQNFPLFGTFIASLLRGDQSALPTFVNRAYVLHAMVIPITIVLSIRSFRSLNRRETHLRPGTNLAWILPVLLTILWSPIPSGLGSLPAAVHVAPSIAQAIRPEWYLMAPFFLMSHLPEDLVASAIFLWFGGLLLLPLMHARIRSQRTVTLIAWLLALSYVVVQVLAVVL